MKPNSKKKTLSSLPKADSFIWADISQSDLSEMWLEVNRDVKESSTPAIPIEEIKHSKPESSRVPIPIKAIKHNKPKSSRAPIKTIRPQKS